MHFEPILKGAGHGELLKKYAKTRNRMAQIKAKCVKKCVAHVSKQVGFFTKISLHRGSELYILDKTTS